MTPRSAYSFADNAWYLYLVPSIQASERQLRETLGSTWNASERVLVNGGIPLCWERLPAGYASQLQADHAVRVLR